MKTIARLLVAALVFSAWVALPAHATTCTVTEFTASGTLTAERLNQRVRQLEACLNGKVGNVNWNPAEQLAVSNLANQNAIYSQAFTIQNNAATGSVGGDLIAQVAARTWRIPVTSKVIGMTMRLNGCASCSVTVTLNVAGSPIQTFPSIAVTTTQTTFILNSSVTNAQDMTIDISGTFTSVKAIDIVVYEKAQHQT